MQQTNLKYKIQLGSIAILVTFALLLILSRNADSSAPVTFALKRVQEKVFLKLTPSVSGRADYMSRLLDNRLKELQSVVLNKNYNELLYSSLRYSTLAGQITNLVVENNMTDKTENIKKQFMEHQKIINELYVIYPKNTSNLEYKYIEDDYNYLKLYLDKLSKS